MTNRMATGSFLLGLSVELPTTFALLQPGKQMGERGVLPKGVPWGEPPALAISPEHRLVSLERERGSWVGGADLRLLCAAYDSMLLSQSVYSNCCTGPPVLLDLLHR